MCRRAAGGCVRLSDFISAPLSMLTDTIMLPRAPAGEPRG
ncbi:YceK/YidQ family lipoprotein [Cronobacter dublinensis]|nr:YceK/YidQ family lipoprotein [Cronobacter dublinensis]EMD9248444.1 YceK/YidQ family lipoprotein [Cronobacter dublinensis]